MDTVFNFFKVQMKDMKEIGKMDNSMAKENIIVKSINTKDYLIMIKERVKEQNIIKMGVIANTIVGKKFNKYTDE